MVWELEREVWVQALRQEHEARQKEHEARLQEQKELVQERGYFSNVLSVNPSTFIYLILILQDLMSLECKNN